MPFEYNEPSVDFLMSRPVNPIRTEFSHRTRAYNLARLRAELFDILVVGGGIAGAAIARDAALRGYKVALVEKDDFASGSSSETSKLIRGNRGYLDRVNLFPVYRAAQERNRLLRNAAYSVWPLRLVHLIPTEGPALPAHLDRSLWLYDLLSLARASRRHRMLSAAEVCRQFPSADSRKLAGGALYYEAQTDDSRLTLETILSAHRRGAVIVNHFQVEELSASTGKQIDGVCGRDVFSDEFITARARVVVNAAGPWFNAVSALEGPGQPSPVSFSRVVHLLVPWRKFPVQEGLSFLSPEDGRMLYVLPYDGMTLIGPSEREHTGTPEGVHAEIEDLDWILNAVRKMFPRQSLYREDVVSTFAGVRTNITNGGPSRTGLRASEHSIWVTASGLLNLAGGDLGTHRATAEEVVNQAARTLRQEFGVRPFHPVRTIRTPIIEWRGRGDVLSRAQMEAYKSLPAETRDYLSRTYGLRLGRLLEYVRSDDRLRGLIVDGLPYIWAEVPHAVEQEMALSVSDLLARRLNVFHLVPDGAVMAAHEVARYMARLADWMDPDIEQQTLSYVNAVNVNRSACRPAG